METFDQELGKELLGEVLRENDVMVGRWHLSEIFAALVETYDRGQWAKLAKHLGCSSPEEARILVRRSIPRALRQHPRILRALSIAAGARVPHIVSQEGEQVALQFTMISEERRVGLIQEFQEAFSTLLQEYEPFEVGVAFTGTAYGVVLLDLIRRYFRGRFLVEPCFPRLAEEPVEGFNDYREQIRAFYGLDPLEGPTLEDAGEYARALASEAGDRGWRVLMQAVDGDLPKSLTQAFGQKKIKLLAVLNDWTRNDVLSYVDIQNLTILPALLDPVKEEEPQESKVVDGWSVAKNGIFRHHGKIVKQDTVPQEIRQAFEVEEVPDGGEED